MGAGPGSAEVGPVPVWRAAPRARAPRPSAPRQRLSAAPVSSMAARRVGSGEWGVGSGASRGRARGGAAAGPYPPGWGSRRPTINPSLRKIAPRRAAQPLNIRTRAGVWGLAPTRSSAAGENWKNGKKATRIFGVFGVFLPYFFRQRHCGTIQRYGGLREGLRGSLVAWARGVKGLARGGQPAPRPPWVDRPDSYQVFSRDEAGDRSWVSPGGHGCTK